MRLCAVHPSERVIEGVPAYTSIDAVLAHVAPADLAESVVTPPAVSNRVVPQALARGVASIWCQLVRRHVGCGC